MNLHNIIFQPFQPTAAPVPTQLAGWMSNPSAVSHPAVSGAPMAPMGLGGPANPGTVFSSGPPILGYCTSLSSNFPFLIISTDATCLFLFKRSSRCL